ncbi:MAG: J domain-containing protein [Acidimicrobiales bacterium]|nr:J domain-containing protein [Acidimicrobiales bacterium]
MTPEQAAQVLGVSVGTDPQTLRAAYLRQIRTHHPDRAGSQSQAVAAAITEAFRVLSNLSANDTVAPPSAPPPPPPPPQPPAEPSDAITRLGPDSLLLAAPGDEAFKWLLDASHDVGAITYLDRSMPIAEVLCRFVGEPATSLVFTLQGRGHGTEVFCTVESIESRPPPPTEAVVDLLEDALRLRH